MGKGGIIYVSRNQKLNTKGSKEAKLVGADGASSLILRTKLFLEPQGYKSKQNVLYQDNKSTKLLQETVKIFRVKGQVI